MKTRLQVFGVVSVFCGMVLSGCASSQSVATADSKKGRYITLPPETGSRLPRRVWVNEDGTIAEPASAVQRVNPEAMGNLQRQGSATRGATGQ